MGRVYKNLCLATISASIMAANMWKNSLKITITIKFYTKPYSIFLQRNGTYCLNKPRSMCGGERTCDCTLTATAVAPDGPRVNKGPKFSTQT